MRTITKLYDRLVDGMALISALLLIWLMVAVTGSVIMRNVGLQPYAWLFTSTEYAMLYITMLGAPWLVRMRGHVHIELVTATLPDPARILLSRVVAAACVMICLYLGWKGYQLVLSNIARSDFDVRSYYFPRWILTIAFPISFGLMAIEFARFVVGQEVMHSGEAGIHE